jgi:hypothetical protein
MAESGGLLQNAVAFAAVPLDGIGLTLTEKIGEDSSHGYTTFDL